jgi:aconitate hydratase
MPITVGHDTAKTRKTLTVGDRPYAYYSIAAAEEAGLGDFSKLPAALKVVLENMLRFEDGKTVMSMTSRRFPNGPRRAARTRARSPIARRAC